MRGLECSEILYTVPKMAKEDVEDASGEGEQECWFGVWELERLLLEWGKSRHPHLWG